MFSPEKSETIFNDKWQNSAIIIKENYVPRISYGDKNRLFIDKLN